MVTTGKITCIRYFQECSGRIAILYFIFRSLHFWPTQNHPSTNPERKHTSYLAGVFPEASMVLSWADSQTWTCCGSLSSFVFFVTQWAAVKTYLKF